MKRKCETCGKMFKPTQTLYYETECTKCNPPRETKLFNGANMNLKGKYLYHQSKFE